jgi:hypothetical protein
MDCIDETFTYLKGFIRVAVEVLEVSICVFLEAVSAYSRPV